MRLASVLVGLAALLGSIPTAWASPPFEGLGDLPGGDVYSEVFGISADGSVVVGESTSASGFEAFRWTEAEGMVGLGDLPGGIFESVALAVSSDGSVVVGTSVSTLNNCTLIYDCGFEAFRWTEAEGMVGLGDLPGGIFFSGATGVSADGSVVVGAGTTASGFEAFRWTEAEGMVGLGELPGGIFESVATGVSADGSVVVGWSASTSDPAEPFRWTEAGGMVGLGRLGPDPDIDGLGGAFGVSADGSVVVGATLSVASGPFSTEAFRWTGAGGMVGLGSVPGGSFDSEAWAVSADGSVVVGVSNGAFVWDETNGMRELDQVLTELGADLMGWSKLLGAYGISADGKTIAGDGANPDGFGEAWIATLPEPASNWLAMAALLTLLVVRQRRV